jgi:hypothetical protein
MGFKNNIFQMATSVFQTLTESVSEVFHDSASHIPWNSVDFFGDGSLQFIDSSGTMCVHLCLEVAPQKKIAWC